MVNQIFLRRLSVIQRISLPSSHLIFCHGIVTYSAVSFWLKNTILCGLHVGDSSFVLLLSAYPLVIISTLVIILYCFVFPFVFKREQLIEG